VVYRHDQEKYENHLDFMWRRVREKAPCTELYRVRPWPYGSGYADDEGNPKYLDDAMEGDDEEQAAIHLDSLTDWSKPWEVAGKAK
jgi:hypothetical protein